tara:strand:- start:160 stop:333 length:174 start_codon:yes stop_codon:yes gene_type:complete
MNKEILDNIIIKIMNEYYNKIDKNIAGVLTIDLPSILNETDKKYIVNIIRNHIKGMN